MKLLAPKSLKIILFCLAVLPACFLGGLVLIYGVNVPFWDQWGIGQLFAKLHKGSFTVGDFFAQSNESRLVFPKLVFLSLGYLTHWDVRYEMLLIFLLACIISFNIYLLSTLTIGGSTVKRLIIAVISNLLIFGPIQWRNWLWGIQLIVFVPIACITACILVAYSRLEIKIKVLIFICLSTISTYSYANGVLCWLVTFPILGLKARSEFARNRWLIFAWIAAFVLNVTAYFYNYVKPANHPSFSIALERPQQAIHYFLSFLGSPLGFGSGIEPIILAPIIGLTLMLLFAASCIYILKFSTGSVLLEQTAGWLTIGGYTILSATITTFGRVGFGVEQSIDSRYTTFSVYLTVSLLYILVIIADDIKKKRYFASGNFVTLFTFALAAIVLCLHSLTSIHGVQQMSVLRTSHLQGKACLTFINFVQEDRCLTTKVFPFADVLKDTANTLDEMGFLKPGLMKSNNIQDFKTSNEVSSEKYGRFDTLTQVSIDEYVASGWAVLPEKREPSDVVILTYEDGNRNFNALAVVEGNTRNNIDKASETDLSFSRWQKNLHAKDFLKEGYFKINAWAYDSHTGRGFKLNGDHVIKTNTPIISIPEITNVKQINFKSSLSNANGFFDGVTDGPGRVKIEVPKSGPFRISGWAVVSEEVKPADLVLITYGDANTLLAVGTIYFDRPDVAKFLKNSAYQKSGWDTIINSDSMPKGTVALKGWAYSSTRKEATQLNNSLQVTVLD